MSIKIPELYEVISLKKVVEVLKDALSEYPKLMAVFPNEYIRTAALEATLWYYGAFDMHYGKAYTLSEEADEVALIVESKEARYSKGRCMKAGSYSIEYQEAKEKMGVDDRKKRLKFIKELNKLEKKVKFPKEFLYIDFFGVSKEKQGQGKGGELMDKIIAYADKRKLPLLLFTNTARAKNFYEGKGFKVVDTIVSEKFGFESSYMQRDFFTQMKGR